MKTIPVIFIVLISAASSVLGQCPSLSVIGPDGVTEAGDKMRFRLESAVGDLKYFWSVDRGTIVEGQGTPAIIVVTTNADGGTNLTARVEVTGLLLGCEKSALESAPIAPHLYYEPVDYFGDLTDNDERSRLDTLFAELANNPHRVALIILQVTKTERRDEKNQRVQLVIRHARFRKFDLSRIWFGLRFGPDRRTTFYRVAPERSDEIPCDECQIIKGGDIK